MKIYVELLEEGTSVSRPVEAVQVGTDVYQIVEENLDIEDEKWAFTSGAKVRCRRVVTRDGKNSILVAYEEVAN